jgi:hypothetical protein
MEFDCKTSCGSKFNIVFFVIFIIIVQYVFLNLFVLILLDSFQKNYINEDNPVQSFRIISKRFKKAWIRQCSKIEYSFLYHDYLADLISHFEKPYGLGLSELEDANKDPTFIIEKKKRTALLITKMHLSYNSKGFVFFNEVLFCIYRRYFKLLST